jgi:hypothetical protein
MGSEMFRKVQYGKETVRGTAVAATKMWMGSATLPKDREPVHPQDALGLRVRAARTEILQLLADPVTLAMDGDAGAYYQGLPLLLGTTLRGGVTASETTGGQGDYAWDFSPSLTAAAAPDTMTLEIGDNDQNYEIEYLMGKTLTFDWAFGENGFMNVSGEYFGRQVTPSTATGSLTRPTITAINANTGKFYVDTAWSGLGGTQKTGLLRSGNIQIATGNHPKWLGSGNRYFDSYGEGYLDVTGQLVLEGGAEAKAIFDLFQAGTARALRFSWTGPQIGTGTNHSLRIDVFAAFDEVIPLSGFADGNTLYSVTFTGVTDNLSTAHLLGVAVTTNSNAY